MSTHVRSSMVSLPAQPKTRNCERHIDSWGTTWNEALPGQIVVLPCDGADTTGKSNTRNCERHIDSWGTTWNEALPGQIVVLPCNGADTTGKSNTT